MWLRDLDAVFVIAAKRRRLTSERGSKISVYAHGLKLNRFPSWPGLSRASTPFLLRDCEDVDARHKAGHDGVESDSHAGTRLRQGFAGLRQRRTYRWHRPERQGDQE